METLFNDILIRPIITLLVIVYQVLYSFHVPYALGFSIILLTIIIKFILYPLTSSYLKVSKKMQALNPHLSHLKEKHKGDAKRIQQETMRLYKEHGVNPMGGCLPSLLQLPIIWALYSVLIKIVALKPEAVVSGINHLIYKVGSFELTMPWDPSFFGIPLGKHPSELVSTMPLILLIPVITGVSQFIQSKMIMSTPPTAIKKLKVENEKLKVNDKKKSTQEDFAQAFQAQSLYIFPAMIGFFSFTFPIGISLYWITQTIFGILQQYQVLGFGGLQSFVDKSAAYIKSKNK